MHQLNTDYVEEGAPLEAPPDHDDDPTINPHIATIALLIASVFELIAACLVCGDQQCTGLVAYSVVVGIISLILLAPVALVLFAEPLAPRRLPEGLPHLSLLLLMWWMPAGFLLTFIGPFHGLCNGYFAVLGGTAFALQLARVHVPGVDASLEDAAATVRSQPTERTVLVLLALSSTAVWVEAAVTLGSQPADHPGAKSWAIVIGVVSSVMCAFHLLLSSPINRLGFATLMAAWWCQGIAVSFMPSGFIDTVNGFVATWASVLLAAYFLRSTRSPRDLEPIPSAEPEDGSGGPTTSYVSQDPPDPSDGFSGTLSTLGTGSLAASLGSLGAGLGKLGPDTPNQFRHTGTPGDDL